MAADGSSNLGASTTAKGIVMIRVGCVGTSPLLMNAMDKDTLLRLVTGEKAPKGAPKGTPLEQATKRLYLDATGKKVIMPVQNVLASMIEAGRRVRMEGKTQVSTASSTILPSFLTIEESELALVDPKDNKKQARWAEDIMLGRNPNGGEAVGICRPRFNEWAFYMTLSADLSTVPERIVRELVYRAGTHVGLCDFRPQRKGTFGRFRIDEWKIEPGTEDTAGSGAEEGEGSDEADPT
mgnify:FL=1